MSLQKFESDVQPLHRSQPQAYYMLSDLSHLSVLQARLTDPQVQERLADQLPADRLGQVVDLLQKAVFEPDSISLPTPVGNIVMRVVEREEPKLVKLESEGNPIALTLWIQIAGCDEFTSKMRVTIGADVNIFMKGLVAKPLQQAADGIAQALAAAAQMPL